MKSTTVKQNVGIDIAKKDFKANFQVLNSAQERKVKRSSTFGNRLSVFERFVNWVEKSRDPEVEVRITIEATGVYYEQLVHYLHDHTDYRISVLLPNKSKAYFKSLNIKTKTDKIDATVLGQMGIERNLKK